MTTLKLAAKLKFAALGTVLAAGLGYWTWLHMGPTAGLADRDDPTLGYFPLTVGRSWTYQVETDMTDSDIDPEITLSVDRKVELDGKATWVRRSIQGAEYYIQRDAKSVYRVASRTDVEEQATLDNSPRTILKMPLKPGTQWDGGFTAPFLLRRTSEFPNNLVHSHKALMSFSVVAVNETVEVPYGTFKGCIQVKGEASLRLYTSPVTGFTDVPLITHEWYCPNVGLVKFDREERVAGGGAFMTGGKVSYQLTDMTE
ncbi:MAG TPA: hypothetical protein VGE55_03395 [Limnobacter sp.]|uniref:hypothetical protein n=1 Tax=Limnobacter sp. TaxID=2003368 RepID=UPI002ED9719D